MRIPFFFYVLILSGLGEACAEDPLTYHVPDSGVSGDVATLFSFQESHTPPRFTAALMSGSTVLTQGQSFTFELAQGRQVQAALLGLSCAWDPGTYRIRLIDVGGKPLEERPFTIVKRPYESMDIPLDRSLTTLLTKPDPQKEKEGQEVWALYSSFHPEAVHSTGPFQLPVEQKHWESAFYGDRRRYLYAGGTSSSTYHWGLDLACQRGTTVTACGAGQVRLAKPLVVTGNTVIIEHLPGVFTIYMHMNEIFVEPGQLLGPGDEVGAVGSTGLATGPHLHWEIRVNTIPVEPKSWLRAPVLDKAAMLAIITSTPRKGR